MWPHLSYSCMFCQAQSSSAQGSLGGRYSTGSNHLQFNSHSVDLSHMQNHDLLLRIKTKGFICALRRALCYARTDSQWRHIYRVKHGIPPVTSPFPSILRSTCHDPLTHPTYQIKPCLLPDEVGHVQRTVCTSRNSGTGRNNVNLLSMQVVISSWCSNSSRATYPVE